MKEFMRSRLSGQRSGDDRQDRGKNDSSLRTYTADIGRLIAGERSGRQMLAPFREGPEQLTGKILGETAKRLLDVQQPVHRQKEQARQKKVQDLQKEGMESRIEREEIEFQIKQICIDATLYIKERISVENIYKTKGKGVIFHDLYEKVNEFERRMGEDSFLKKIVFEEISKFEKITIHKLYGAKAYENDNLRDLVDRERNKFEAMKIPMAIRIFGIQQEQNADLLLDPFKIQEIQPRRYIDEGFVEGEMGPDMRRSSEQNAEDIRKLQEHTDNLINECTLHFKKFDEDINKAIEHIPGAVEYLEQELNTDLISVDSHLLHRYDQEEKKIITQLPGMAELLEHERVLGIDEYQMFLIEGFEKLENIKYLNIYDKIKYVNECYKEEENKQGKNAGERYETFNVFRDPKNFGKHLNYLSLQQKMLQLQYDELGKKVKEYKYKRNKLTMIPNLQELRDSLTKKHLDSRTVFKGRPLSYTTAQNIFEQAVKNYKPEGVSPLLLSRTTNLDRLASKTIFDGTIAKMQELQKRAAEDLDLDDYNDNHFFLKSQKRETKYYSEDHPNLVILQQEQTHLLECGNICTLMAAADKDKGYIEDWNKFDGVSQEFDRLSPPELALPQGVTDAIMFPIVLKRRGHPIEYEHFDTEKTFFAQWKHPAMLPPYLYQEYSDSTGRVSRDITADQLKGALSKKGNEDAIFVLLTRKCEGSARPDRNHFILIDGIETKHDEETGLDEEYIIYRDPTPGHGAAISWHDFLEVWGGEVCIPVGVVPHDHDSLLDTHDSLRSEVPTIVFPEIPTHEVQQLHPQHEEDLQLQKIVDRIVDELVPLFQKYDEETKRIIAQLPGVQEHLEQEANKRTMRELDSPLLWKYDGEMKKIIAQLPEALECLQEEGEMKQNVETQLFWKYDKNTKNMAIHLPEALEHLEQASEQSINEEWRYWVNHYEKWGYWMNHYEKWANIDDAPISEKINNLKEHRRNSLEEENRREKTTSGGLETLDWFGKNQEFLYIHMQYRILQLKFSKAQYKELGEPIREYGHKRRQLIYLQNLQELRDELVKKDQDSLTFLEKLPLSPAIKQGILEQALKRYNPKGVSPLIISRTTKLESLANKEIFDDKIAKMREIQNRAAKDLGLERNLLSDWLPNSSSRGSGGTSFVIR